MKYIIFIISGLILFLESFGSENNIRILESLSMHSNLLDQEVKYSLILPEGYFSSNQNYPVVYLLHGLGDDETSWLEYSKLSQMADQAVQDGSIIPMIYVMPQGFRSYYVNDYAGVFPYQDMFVQELIPFIDSCYRTKRDGKYRATMGYSMGGFGALILPLKFPDFFSACVPLSISIRTDEQYMNEDPLEWSEQWGRLFGGVGKTGNERITGYYKENSPFHIIAKSDPDIWKSLRIYIDNGDDERTLALSNEELHILLREKNIKHEFRVRNGGHDFSYWNAAIPNGLKFISDSFQGKLYRGDLSISSLPEIINNSSLNSFKTSSAETDLYLPEEYVYTSRYYPVIYIIGDLKKSEKEWIADHTAQLIKNVEIRPLIIAFLSLKKFNLDNNNDIILELEENFRIRKGYRFRSIIGIGREGGSLFNSSLKSQVFTSYSMVDVFPDYELFRESLSTIDSDPWKRSWIYINYPEMGPYYKENGKIHMDLRSSDIYHEYRVREGSGGFEWSKAAISEALIFSEKKIHR